jgi:hypothetical protein
LLEEAGGALLCDPGDVDCMARAIEAQLGRFRTGAAAPAPRPEVVARYEYRALAARLTEVFDRVVERDLVPA